MEKMSNYVTPFLVLNVGTEMVFVVAQRLQAQSVATERANLGSLDDVHYFYPTQTHHTLVEFKGGTFKIAFTLLRTA